MKSACAVAIVFALLAACGGGVVQAPPKPKTAQGGIAVHDPAVITLEIGERLVAAASVLGLSVGTLDMRLTENCSRGQDDHWLLQSKLGTAGLVRWFNKTKGSTTTQVDKATLLPRESTTVVIKDDVWRRYHVQFGEGSYTFYQTRSNGNNEEGSEESPGNEPIYDTQTGYLLLRSWQPKPGEKSYFYVVLGKELWRTDVSYRGKEPLDTPDGPVTARRIEGLAHRINLKPGDEYTPRKLSMWLSDDDARIPLKVVGDGSLGSIHFDLEEREIVDPCQQVAVEEVPHELVAEADTVDGEAPALEQADAVDGEAPAPEQADAVDGEAPAPEQASSPAPPESSAVRGAAPEQE